MNDQPGQGLCSILRASIILGFGETGRRTCSELEPVMDGSFIGLVAND